MNLELTADQQQVIDLAISSGAYRTPGEVLEQAFDILREQLHSESGMSRERHLIAAHIENGFAQAERGEFVSGDLALDMLRERRAALPGGE